MSKRVLIVVLVVVAFTCTCCHRKAKQPYTPTLPSLWITMAQNQYNSIYGDTENKEAAEALLTDAHGDTLYQGALAHIKTRGNTTFKEAKKPFTIKFPKKQCFLGLEPGKSFVLLANALDESHIRNAIGLDLARIMGIPAPRYAYLSLYINNSYIGLYQITNKVDVGKHALDITDLDKLNQQVNPKPLDEYEWFGFGREKELIHRKGVLLDNNPDDITGGYLLDITGPVQQYFKSTSGFVSTAKDNVRIRSPKYASPQEVDYIVERYNEMQSAVMAADGFHPETGRHYTEYLDRESFARYYLLNEIMFNHDANWASFMLYKDRDANDPKFHAGPAWDYDRTLDNPRFTDVLNTKEYSNEMFASVKADRIGMICSGGLLYYLCQHEDFQQAVRDCYLNCIGPKCHAYLEAHLIDSLATLLAQEADRDYEKNEGRYSKTYEVAVNRATAYLRDRIAFLDWYCASTQEEQVTITALWRGMRTRKFYYPTEEAIEVPHLAKSYYNHDPVYELYYAGTDSLVPEGIIFHEPQTLELRGREPTKREVQIRRVKKKLAKIGIRF